MAGNVRVASPNVNAGGVVLPAVDAAHAEVGEDGGLDALLKLQC